MQSTPPTTHLRGERCAFSDLETAVTVSPVSLDAGRTDGVDVVSAGHQPDFLTDACATVAIAYKRGRPLSIGRPYAADLIQRKAGPDRRNAVPFVVIAVAGSA